MRHDNRQAADLRPITIQRNFTRSSPGSVLIQAGRTTVLCTASVLQEVPAWMAGKQRGWITAEYGMLPGSTGQRKARDRGGKVDSRSLEIQRLIGRSLRAVADLSALGERTVALDCDVLEADGGTRTLSITGAMVALVDALHTVIQPGEKFPLSEAVAAVSVGILGGRPILDLDYKEDSAAEVDMNVVMTGGGRFVEVQGSGEESTFTESELSAMIALARGGIERLITIQRESLGKFWPFS
jgi:ribonuclease PH